MNGWNESRLASFCTTGTGGTPSRSQLARYYEGGTIPWVKSGELRESVITQTEEKVTEVALNETNVKLVPVGALLLAMYGATVGRLGVLGVSATTNQAVCHIIPDPKVAETRYLFHALSHQVPSIVARGVGGAQPNISQGIVKDISVPLPPLNEQRRIAEVLDRAEALRAKRRAALAQLDTLTQSIFLDLFGHPARNTKGLPTTTLGALGVWQSGGTPPRSRSDYFDGAIPWFSSGELESMYVSQSAEHLSGSAIAETSAKRVPAGALMLGMYDTAALKASIAAVDGSCNQAIAFSRLNEKLVLTQYAYCAIVIGREHFKRLQRGVRQKNLNLSMVREIEIPLPPMADQETFVRRLAAIEKLRTRQRASLAELDALFASLQHRAFRGEL